MSWSAYERRSGQPVNDVVSEGQRHRYCPVKDCSCRARFPVAPAPIRENLDKIERYCGEHAAERCDVPPDAIDESNLSKRSRMDWGESA